MSQAKVFMSVFIGLVLLALASPVPPSSAQDTPVTFHATAVNLSNVGRQGMFTIEIGIERWSTDEEFARLKDTLVEKGSDQLLSQLQKIKPRAGYIRRGTG